MLPFRRVGKIIHSQPRQEAHVQALNVHQHSAFSILFSHFPVHISCSYVSVCVCLHADEAVLEATLEAL